MKAYLKNLVIDYLDLGLQRKKTLDIIFYITKNYSKDISSEQGYIAFIPLIH